MDYSSLSSLQFDSAMYETLAKAFKALDVSRPVVLNEDIDIDPIHLSTELSDVAEDYDSVCVLYDGDAAAGWISLEDLHDEIEDSMQFGGRLPVSEMVKPLSADLIVSSSTTLHDLAPMLAAAPRKRRFIANLGKISHSVTYTDLECQPFRICVLSLTLDVEQQTRQLIANSVELIEFLRNLPIREKELAVSRFRQTYDRDPEIDDSKRDKVSMHPASQHVWQLLDMATLIREFVSYGHILRFIKSRPTLSDLLPAPGIRLVEQAADIRNTLVHDQPLLGHFADASDLMTSLNDMADIARELELLHEL